MSQRLLLFLFVFASIRTAAQTNQINFKGKTYPATASWDFLCERYALTGIAKVQVAKFEKSGLLKLAVTATDKTFAISGTVYVFLTDNTVITCSDKGLREVSGDQIISYYQFSPVEMDKLKSTEIGSIHFNIKGKAVGFNSPLGNFTATNRKSYFSTAFDKTKKSYDTTAEITALEQ